MFWFILWVVVLMLVFMARIDQHYEGITHGKLTFMEGKQENDHA
jgi:hypothetical protein